MYGYFILGMVRSQSKLLHLLLKHIISFNGINTIYMSKIELLLQREITLFGVSSFIIQFKKIFVDYWNKSTRYLRNTPYV